MTPKEIVADYLRCNGYHGLFDSESGCCCTLEDIGVCGAMGDSCEPGWRIEDAPPGRRIGSYSEHLASLRRSRED